MNQLSPCQLGQFIGPELLKREFKELCLQNIFSYFEIEEIKAFLYNNVALDPTIFNRMILDNLHIYMEKYIPKYIGNFSKASIDGDLYIGVNDLGYIEGIPIDGELTIDMVKQMISNAKHLSRGFRTCHSDPGDATEAESNIDPSIVDWYYDNLQIDIIELDIKSDILTLADDYMRSLELIRQTDKSNEEIKLEWDAFRIRYIDWHNRLTTYSGKLLNYLTKDELKAELIAYIRNQFDINPIYDQTQLEPIVEFFTQDISVFEKISFSIDFIEKIMTDFYNPIRWLMAFKDHMLKIIKKEKPSSPSVKSDYGFHYRYCNNIYNIKPQLIMSNDNIRFYMIKIHIPYMPDTYLEYKLPKSDMWLSKARILINGEPSCE
jgi:hypothetical protein